MAMRHSPFTVLILAAMLAAQAAWPQVRLIADGEIVAYGIDARGDMPPMLRRLMDGDVTMESESRYSAAMTQRQARHLRQRQALPPATTIGPLLASVRDQDAPYNWLCPRWTYDDGHESDDRCLSGCVATCIEQLMAYYRHPAALADTLHGWQTAHYTVADMLPGTRFDWANYLDDYRGSYTQAQGEAIALASLAAGMAVRMNYGLSSSGASLWEAELPLRQALDYGMVRLYDRVLYSPARWHAILRHELSNGRPVAYAAHTMSINGHAFNIDGVDTRGFYHVNWGYNGKYDGWYDIDWLDPWEPTGHLPDEIVMGFFCNHTLLAMHPSADARPLEPDTFRTDSLGVKLHAIELLRQPDTNGYVAADLDFENKSRDTITYTYEVMSYLPTDTAIFMQADYVGLAGLTLLPGERRRQRAYLQFGLAGERLLGISHDDVTIPFSRPVSIAKGTPSRLEWGEATMRQPSSGEAVFTIPVANTAADGTAGDLVYYCLAPEGSDEDSRHYEVLSLPAGQQTELEVAFGGLLPQTRYTFRLRCPWSVQAQVDFTTPPAAGIQTIGPDSHGHDKGDMPTPATTARAARHAYATDGKPATAHTRILVARGRKYIP